MNLGNLPWYYWLIALVLLGGAWWLKKRADDLGMPRSGPGSSASAQAASATGASSEAAPSSASPSPATGGSELVAVIAAAVAEASGMHPSQFRIAGISANSAGSAAGTSGWNTPVWGRVERFARPENHR